MESTSRYFIFDLRLGSLLVPDLLTTDTHYLNTMLKYEGDIKFFPSWQTCKIQALSNKLNAIGDIDTDEPSKFYKSYRNDTKIFHVTGYLNITNSVSDYLNSQDLSNILYTVGDHTGGSVMNYTLTERGNCRTFSGTAAVLLNPISNENFSNNIYIELKNFLNWLVKHSKIENLENKENVTIFLAELVRSTSISSPANRDNLKYFMELILKYFDKFGVDTVHELLGRDKKPAKTVNEQAEANLESEINGRLWFGLESLLAHWHKFGITKADILHYAELGKLQICTDWVAQLQLDEPYWFKFCGGQTKTISRFIEFTKRPVNVRNDLNIDVEANDLDIHKYDIDIPSKSEYARLASISANNVRELIAKNQILSPNLKVNEFELKFPHCNFLILHENQLIVTTREVRLFEKKYLNPARSSAPTKTLKEEMASDENQLTIPIENSTGWLEILVETLRVHFPENRTRDPKKASVVEWIKAEAKKKGINPSDNIANAIFTIIKPDNHNPKKPRG
ncbi:hypothetical protein [Paraglaciecola polaris]|uniref:Uncharacterized protein n=1 Tax=Paraglaciecola polaris LMG 21857 TaxID=1129793 RepID=K6ZVU2_9ALTE|nr:hypothetical protein [Paraglaciecola polaris]GAC32908.1 hypothetical protein GPLA_2001 [Paraglaciecola polaris LMG 21857]